MDLFIKGKNALVTGGSRGLGRQCALSLASEGVNVAICGRTKNTLNKTVEELRALGVHSVGIIADVAEVSEMESLYEEAVNGIGEIDILVNNAGGTKAREDIANVSMEGYKETFDLNLFGGFKLMQLSIPHMQSNKWGRIINIASIWGREYGGNISYMSAKSALIAATKHAALSLAKDGILVNSIAPGSIAHQDGSWERFQTENPEHVVQDFIKQNLPLGKFGWPEPVGDLVAFLSSDRAGLITGACILVDGGQSYSMI